MKTLFIFIIFVNCFYFNKIKAFELVKISNEIHSPYGIYIQDKNHSYIYFTQTSLISINKLSLSSTADKNISFRNLELAKYADLARVEILDKNYTNSLIIDKNKAINFGTKFTIQNVNGKILTGKIIGIGQNYFETDISSPLIIPGTPAIIDDNAIGLATKIQQVFNDTSPSSPDKLFLSRLNKIFIWIKYDPKSFSALKKNSRDSYKFFQPYQDIVNFWCKNPYKKLPKQMNIPNRLQGWVQEHNQRTKIYPKILKMCKEHPVQRKGLIHNIIQGTLNRGNLLQQYARTKINQFKIQQSTPFLNLYSKYKLQQWQEINNTLQTQIKNIEYMLPYDFEKYYKPKKAKKNLKKRKKKKKKAKEKLKKEILNGNTDNLLICQSGTKHFLSAIVKFDDGLFVLMPQSYFLEDNIIPLKFFNLSTGEEVSVDFDNFYLSQNFIRIKINSDAGKGLTIAPKNAKSKCLYSMNNTFPVVHIEPLNGSNLNKNLKYNIDAGAIILDEKQRLIGFGVRNDTLFSEKYRFKMCRLKKEQWTKEAKQLFLKTFSEIRTIIKKVQNLEYIEKNLIYNKLILLKPDLVKTLIPLIQEINQNTFAHKLMRKTSHGAPLGQHKSKCKFYTILLRLVVFHKTINKKLSQYILPSQYLVVIREKIKKKNLALLDKLKKKIKTLEKKHPEIAPTL